MPHGLSDSKALLFEIVPINGDSIIDELSFLLVEECSFLGEVGNKDISEDGRNQCEDSHQDLPISTAKIAREDQGRTYKDPRPAGQSTCWGDLTTSSAMFRPKEGEHTRIHKR